MKRDIYKKLMNLQSSEADALLTDKFDQIDKAVRNAKDNDAIHKQLEVLEQFIYKVSDKAMVLAKYLLEMKPLPVRQYRTQYGTYEGKEYGDVVKKVMELLNRIRYYQAPEILPIYYEGFKAGVRKPLEDKIRDLAQYNLEALQHIGYRPQLDVVHFLNTHKSKNDVYVDFLIENLQHLASVEGELHNMKDENTLVFGYGPLPYTDELDHVRKWLLDEVERLISAPQLDLERKMRLVELLRQFTDRPHHGEPSKELEALLERNTQRVVDIFDKILVFDKRLNSPLPLVLEIEEQLIFIERVTKDGELLKSIDSLITRLHKDYTYKIYRELVGARLDFFSHKNETYEEARLANELELKKLIEELRSPDDSLIEVLEEIASYLGKFEEWKLNSYSGFLNNLAKEKPSLAYQVLERADKNNSPLAEFMGDFLLGFRRAEAQTEFDSTLNLVVKGKRGRAVRLLSLSLTLGELSENDAKLATEILRRTDRFSFLKQDDWRSYDHFLTEVFTKLLAKKDKAYDDLFIELLNSYDNPTTLEIGAIRRELDFNSVSERVRKRLIDILVTIDDLSYECQELLLQIEGEDAQKIIAFFQRRIEQKQANIKRVRQDRYEPVPYHLNKDLIATVKNDKQYGQIIRNVLTTFTVKWSVHNSELSRLFRRIGSYKQPLIQFVRTAKKDDLRKVLNFCDAFDAIDLDVAVEIAKRTADKKIWSSLRSRMYNTGVVSGEYGLSNEHQRKYDYLKENYASDTNVRIHKFVEETLEWLEGLVKAERLRTDEELRLRKVDFEH